MASKQIRTVNKTGVLLNDEIKSMIDDWHLVEDSDVNRIQPAGYDSGAGLEYYQDGILHKLDKDQNPWIEVKSNDMVLLGTWETFNMPNNIVARYYLRQGLTWKGLILLGAGQIDPGYHGKIFGLLYNFTRNSVRIGLKEHIFTVEFCYTTHPSQNSKAYGGTYQNATGLPSILPLGITISSGAEAIEEKLQVLSSQLDAYRSQSEKLNERFFIYLGVVIALFGLLEVIVAIVAISIALKAIP
jgi:deoxycytidine triphosphate deaminase